MASMASNILIRKEKKILLEISELK